jgi:hypothetical protein
MWYGRDHLVVHKDKVSKTGQRMRIVLAWMGRSPSGCLNRPLNVERWPVHERWQYKEWPWYIVCHFLQSFVTSFNIPWLTGATAILISSFQK